MLLLLLPADAKARGLRCRRLLPPFGAPAGWDGRWALLCWLLELLCRIPRRAESTAGCAGTAGAARSGLGSEGGVRCSGCFTVQTSTLPDRVARQLGSGCRSRRLAWTA